MWKVTLWKLIWWHEPTCKELLLQMDPLENSSPQHRMTLTSGPVPCAHTLPAWLEVNAAATLTATPETDNVRFLSKAKQRWYCNKKSEHSTKFNALTEMTCSVTSKTRRSWAVEQHFTNITTLAEPFDIPTAHESVYKFDDGTILETSTVGMENLTFFETVEHMMCACKTTRMRDVT